MPMSKRLQVLLDEPEIREIQRAARAKRMTVAEWVRGVLREARRKEPLGDVGDKITAIRRAARYSFPAPDIEQMLAEIEKGYGAGSSEEP
jgi:predicted 2-oxoglutarate/Fe(II)-dependent dioxygenase YbiX